MLEPIRASIPPKPPAAKSNDAEWILTRAQIVLKAWTVVSDYGRSTDDGPWLWLTLLGKESLCPS